MRLARIVVVISAAAVAERALAVNKSWNAGSGDWSTGANWSPPGVPQPGDIVDIDVGGAVTVTVNSSVPAIASMSCADALTIVAGGQLQVDGASTFASSAVLTLDGTFNAVGGATIDGQFVYSSGTLDGGTVAVSATGALAMTASNTRHLNTTLEVDGDGMWSGAGIVFFMDGVLQIDTVPPDTFDIGGAATISANDNGGTNVVRVNGTLTKVGDATVTFNAGVELENNGVVDLQQGTLACLGGGWSSGDFMGAGATTLNLGGNHSFVASSDIVGDLNVQFSSGVRTFPNAIVTQGMVSATGGMVTIDGGVDAAAIVVSSGSLNLGADSFADMATVFGALGKLTTAPGTSLVVTGTLVWSGGTIGDGTTSTDGSIRVAETGSLNMISSTTRFLSTTLEVDGSGTWSGGGNVVFKDGVLQIDTVPPHGFNVGGAGPILAINDGGTNVVRVNGTLTKGSASVTIANGVQLQNSGLVDLQQGSLGFFGGGSSSGDFIGVAGAKLSFGGSHSFTGASDIVGDLDVQFSSGATTFPNSIVTAGTVSASGGTATIGGGVDAGAVVVSSGSLTLGADSFADAATVSGGFLAATANKSLVVAGTLAWSGGAIGDGTTSTDGLIRVAETGSLNMTAGNTRYLSTTLEVDGAGTWSGAGLAFFVAGVLQVDTVAPNVFNIGGSGEISGNANGGTNVVRVNGTLNKVGTGTVTLNIVQFENNGLLDVQLGEFNAADSSPNLAGTTLSGGHWRVKSTLRLPTTALATIAADVTLDGPAAQILAPFSGTNLLAGLTMISPLGALRLDNGRTQAVPLPLAVNGTLDIDQTSVLAAAANLTFGATGTYSIDFGSDGMGGFGNGKSTVGGAATLGGLVRAVQVDGYIPAQCDAFMIVTAQSVNGMFAAQDLPPVSTFSIWTVAQTATTVTLFFADSDQDDNLFVDGGDLGVLLSQWGGPGSGDLNCDGVVDGGDLGILLSSWGAAS